MPDRPQIICAGRLYCDLVFTDVPRLPTLGTETFAEGLGLHAGGGAFITAAALAALGWPTALWSMLPGAPFDGIVARDIIDSGVDTTFCDATPNGGAPQITVAIATQGDRAFLSHKAGAAIPPRDLPGSPLRHLHIGELRTLSEHPGLIAQARAAGLSISLDCGWDDALLSNAGNLAQLIDQVDVFLPNSVELARLVALGLPENPARLTVVKCSDQGAKAYHRGDWLTAPAHAVSVIDATGAGDAFNGGFIARWLAGDPLEACLAAGNTCGAASVQAAGGTGGFARLPHEMNRAS